MLCVNAVCAELHSFLQSGGINDNKCGGCIPTMCWAAFTADPVFQWQSSWRARLMQARSGRIPLRSWLKSARGGRTFHILLSSEEDRRLSSFPSRNYKEQVRFYSTATLLKHTWTWSPEETYDPSVHLLISLYSMSGSQGCQSLTWSLMGKGGVHPGTVASPSQGQTITHLCTLSNVGTI